MISVEEAVARLRADPSCAPLIRDTYLDEDLLGAAKRFHQSSEFAEVLAFVGSNLAGRRILDLGAGRGIASFAFAKEGARRVYALDPDPSEDLGWGAGLRLRGELPIDVLAGVGEAIPILDGRLDVVYTRQVLHHTIDLRATLLESARVLKAGGLLIATREHVVDDEHQLRQFLENHPVHRLAGGENAFALDRYVEAIEGAGLELLRVLGPWDSVLNAFPAVQSNEELRAFPATLLKRKLGKIGLLVSRIPGADEMIWRYKNRPEPGRLYSFIAVKPL